MKKTTEHTINLQMCIINDSHMMYCPWHMECNRHNFLSFWMVFALLAPPPPPTTRKINILKKLKKRLEILSFYTGAPKMTIIWCMVPEIWLECDGQNFLWFWAIFCPFTPLTTQKIKILKKWKNCLEILSFYTWVP